MKTISAILLVSASLLLTACGGGGGGSSNNPSTSVGDLPSGYIFDYDKNGAKSLVAVDPTDPSIRYMVRATGTYRIIDRILSGSSFDQTTQTVSGAHVAALVYESGGNIFKVADTKPGTPTPVQISSASGVDPCSEVWTNAPPTDQDIAYIVVQTDGLDDSCATTGDNEYLLIRSNMTHNDAPIVAARPLMDVSDETTGLPLGWLAASGGQLLHYDNNFLNPVTLSQTYATVAKELADDFLVIDNQIFHFTPSTDGLQPIHSPALGAWFSDARTVDSDYMYFVQDGSSLYRARRDGSSTATLVFSSFELAGASSLWVTTNRVVFSNSAGTLYSIPHSTVPSTATFIANDVVNFFTRGTRIYFDSFVPTVRSVRVNEDGTAPNELNNSYYVGFTTPSIVSRRFATAELIDKVIRLENLNQGSGSLAGSTLRSIRLSDGAVIASLGTLPVGNYQGLATQNLVFGDANFLQQFLSGPNSPVGSIFFNAAKANSLVSIN